MPRAVNATLFELVPHDSPLKRVPARLSRRDILFLDGIRYSFYIAELAYSRLKQTLGTLSRANEDLPVIAETTAVAVADAWAFIDSVHRLRELVRQVPGLKKSLPDLQLFVRRTEPVEKLRHFVQHFRTEIDEFAKRGIPLWGVLSWVVDGPDGPENYAIGPGTFFKGAAIPSCVFDSQEGRFVQRLLLAAGRTQLDIEKTYEHLRQFASWYAGWYQGEFEEGPHLSADVRFRFRVKRIHQDP